MTMVGTETLWVGVAFFIFLGILAYFGVHKTILAALDKRGQDVSKELNEARRLREEAQSLLNSFENKRKVAEEDARQIIENAKLDALRIEAEGKAKIDDFVKRRTAQAELKIAQAEQQATSDVRAAAADAAVHAAEALIRGGSASQADTLFAEGLADVRANLN